MYRLPSVTFMLFLSILFQISIPAAQDDPVLAYNTAIAPVIDGIPDDGCWEKATWQSIDQVWITYGTTIPASDYNGRYKVIWSSQTNLLYFLIEVNDDSFVDGFKLKQTADVYHYDIPEIFIDEDNSGGLHMFDATGNNVSQYGSNAENAFSYHIYGDFPAAGEVTKNVYVQDLDGTSWSNAVNPNYASHFPDFAIRRNGAAMIWEFSLIVYNDTYEDNNKDGARVQLAVDKTIGLSLAYCDNDDANENPKTRDNFFGSVWVAAANYNDHWMDADDYGNVKLVSDINTGIEEQNTQQPVNIKVYPNPSSGSSRIELNNPFTGSVSIRVFNMLGQEVYRNQGIKTSKNFSLPVVFSNLSSGQYFIQAEIGENVYREKITLTGK